MSIVVPVYGCDGCLETLCERLGAVLEDLVDGHEIILVDDRGPGNPWEIITHLANRDPRVIGVRLSRNFGQHSAIYAGLYQARGEWIVVMDCDLQDVPEELPKLCAAAQEGIDIVFAQRAERNDGFFKRASSRIFYSVLGYLTDTEQDVSVANYGVYSRKVVDAVLSMREVYRYFPVMVRWVGFSSVSIPVKHSSREEGKSSYSFRKLLNLSLDVLLSFSDKPLRIIVGVGGLVALSSILFASGIFLRAILQGVVVPGWASLMVSMWFIGGIIVSIVGVVGLYVGNILKEVKSRPVFLVDDEINANQHGNQSSHSPHEGLLVTEATSPGKR